MTLRPLQAYQAGRWEVIWNHDTERPVAFLQRALPDDAGQPDAEREAAHILSGGPVRP